MSDSLRLPDVKPPCLNSPGTKVPGVFFSKKYKRALQADQFLFDGGSGGPVSRSLFLGNGFGFPIGKLQI